MVEFLSTKTICKKAVYEALDKIGGPVDRIAKEGKQIFFYRDGCKVAKIFIVQGMAKVGMVIY